MLCPFCHEPFIIPELSLGEEGVWEQSIRCTRCKSKFRVELTQVWKANLSEKEWRRIRNQPAP